MSTKSKRSYDAYLRDREEGFNLRFSCSRELPEYNALLDENMTNYFESDLVQKHLLETCQIDQFGRVVSLEKHRSRLRIIENEIVRAEQAERVQQKDEAETRHLVRKERFRDIDKKRRLENVERRKTEMKMQMNLARVEREVLGYSHLHASNRGRTDVGSKSGESLETPP